MSTALFDTFATDIILHYHGAAMDRYLKLKAIGKSSRAALSGAFGPEYAVALQTQTYIDLIETSDAYIDGLPKYVATFKEHAVWSPEVSARMLVSIAADQTLKASDRIAAAKELNVIFNVTIIDEKGNTRAGHTLADFYRMKADAPSNTQTH